MLIRAKLRTTLINALLQGGTAAGSNVFLYAWPMNSATNPCIVINWGRDVKISNGRTVPNFTSTFTIRLDVRVEAIDIATAQAQLDDLLDQIEQVILTNYDLNVQLQQFPTVETVNSTDAESASNVASAIMDIAMETFEIFEPQGIPLNSVTLNVDLQNRFDATGTYSNPPFPAAVVPAPRTTGPDGRNEGYVEADNLSG